MITNSNNLFDIYDEHLLEFRLKLLRDLHEKFFEKYIYIEGENGIIQGYIATIDFHRNEYTHETELYLETISGDSEMHYNIAMSQIKKVFYNDTKEQTLLEVECTDI